MTSRPPSFSRIVALVPVRGLEDAKARLGEVLDAEERRALVEHLLARTVAAARVTPGVEAVAVVSPDPEVLRLAAELGAHGIPQGGEGLNEGLLEALAWAHTAAPDAILVIPGDLPAVSDGELARVVAAARSVGATEAPLEGVAEAAPGGAQVAARAVVALVPDRAGTGTNLLLVAPPAAIPFLFGDGSRAAHAAAALAAGATYLELGGPLSLDLDTPDDLLAAEEAGLGALRVELS